MRTKTQAILAATLAALLAALVYVAAAAGQKPPEGLLLAVPKPGLAAEPSRADLERIEDINGEKFALTYEANRQRTVKALSSSHTAMWKGTNDAYPFVTGKRLLNGSFLTRETMDKKSRAVVLNELAAFEMFGGAEAAGNTVYMDGKAYAVVGVINDRDAESKNIYAPAALFSDAPGAFLAKLDTAYGVTAEYVENALISAGITAADYDFISLDTVTGAAREKAAAAMGLAACLALLALAARGARRFIAACKIVMKLAETDELSNILRDDPSGAAKLFGSGAFTFAAGSALLLALAQIARLFIKWRSFSGMAQIRGYSFTAFAAELQALQDMALRADVLFLVFCGVLALLALSYLFTAMEKPYE